jgi:hydrogenase maturation protein HypF
MKVFRMCDHCSSEYNDILNRRFHAQPVACNQCGPAYHYKSEEKKLDDIHQILAEVSMRIDEGKIVAVKGTGGYNLICDALNDKVVSELRLRKHRDSKPFAVMFRDTAEVRKYCHLNGAEQKELECWRKPVLILEQKKMLAPSVSNGLNTTGAVLPYMPLHFLLFRFLKTPAIVYTSGNLSDEPIIISDDIAEKELFRVSGAIVSYNRTIVNRVDDSVLRIADNKIIQIRRSRGYVPRPVDLPFNADGILAVGAELKNSFCIGKGSQAIMSQYIGDLKNPAALDFFDESLERFSRMFRFKPSLIACDLHPGYYSGFYAQKLSDELNLPLKRIQHHHSHIVSVMAENGLDEDVIGISLDGTGYGTDGNTWGGEFLVAGLSDFTRFAHFDYVALPGGDKASGEPWRTAFSFIYKYFGDNFDYDSLQVFNTIGRQNLLLIKDMLDKKINSPLSSGAGRLFDAVSALLGLCSVSTFDSEAPMRLESITDKQVESVYPFSIINGSVNFSETFESLTRDLNIESRPVIAAKFHNTVASIILDISKQIRKKTLINKVILSGGVFQNKYLLEKSLRLLNHDRFKVLTNHLVPVNDGGISLGQLMIASKLNSLCA